MIISFLKSIFGFLRSRALWILLGIAALCVLVWMFGGLFAFGETRPLETEMARLGLIGLILALFLARLLIVRWRAGRMNERIANMLRSALSADADEGDESQAAILNERFNEALNILRKARFETEQPSFWGRIVRRGRYVYELPWYVIIGAPGVGKTTALLNSGLSFPLSGQIGAAAIRGAGGTRNCDWWFTNEAVFIDTAGRYATHESDARTDKAEWGAFLSLLKKNRSQQPINGALVMLSVAELLGQSLEESQKHAATLRQRLDELRSDFGMSFPVYLLINKCDLLSGFDEYFSALDRSGRTQVWGTTLPFDPSGKYLFDLGKLADESDLLQARINAGLVDALQAEQDLFRRELIYAFPQQFEALAQVLKGMLPDLLGTSRFSESPFLRGIYFTSATQEGTPFDRIVHVLEQGFQLRRQQKAAVAGEGKAYFLNELLSKVVFGEAHIAGQDRRAARRSYAWHVGGYVVSVLALAGASLAWAVSRHNNQFYLDGVDGKIAGMKEELRSLPSAASADVGTLLPTLERAETLLDSDSFKVGEPPLWWRFGLYQGSSLKMKVWGERGLYRQLLSERLLPSIEAGLEQKLWRSANEEEGESAYYALKAYLMLHERERLTGKAFAESVEIAFGNSLFEGELEQLARHAKALVDMDALPSSGAKDERLVADVRDRLNKQTPAERVFSRVKRSPRFEGLHRFSLTSALDGHVWPLIDKRGDAGDYFIASLYTKNGYELYKKERDHALALIEDDEPWVLGIGESARRAGASMASDRLRHSVDVLYAREYISNWDSYLGNVDIYKPKNLLEAAQIAGQLSTPDSPLLRFLRRAAQETALLEDLDKKDDALDSSLRERARQRIDRIAGVQGVADAASGRLLPQMDAPAMEVNRHFADLRKFVNGTGKDAGDAPILQEMKEFSKIKEVLDLAIHAQENRQPMPGMASLTALSTSPPGRLPKGPFKNALQSIAAASKEAITMAKNKHVTGALNDEVTEFCKKAISGRYPFSPSAEASVTEGAFTDMFGPDGRMDRFRQQQGSGTALPAAFSYASTIKDTFFRRGGRPEMSFTIRPVQMDASITNLSLNIGGQQIRYAHGPSVSASVTWPAADSQVRLALLPTVDSGRNDIAASGLWALHRLFDRHGQMRRGSSPDVFEVVLNVGGRRAIFEIQPTGTFNPFDLSELRKFKCPQVMPQD